MFNSKLSKIVFAFLFLMLIVPSFALANAPNVDWWAEYYNNNALEGNYVKIEHEPAIDYDWGYGAPQGLPNDNFSVRWTTTTDFDAGTYTFSITADDGVRVWIDGELLIDKWQKQAVKTFTAKKYLSGGAHTVQVAYFEATGAAVAKFWWRLDQPGTPPPTPTPPPAMAKTVVVDNLDAGFTWGGSHYHRHKSHGGFGKNFFWTKNTTYYPENYAKWTPTFSNNGKYEVYVFVPAYHATTTNLRYRIYHNGKRDDVIIDQAWYYNEWVSLGTYYFNADNNGKEFVIVYDNTHEHYASESIAFDAIKFAPK